MRLLFTFLLMALMILGSCKTPSTISADSNGNSAATNFLDVYNYKFHYKAKQDAEWIQLELDEDEWPKPTIGKEAWLMRMYREMRYPAVAREASVQGTVVLEVDVKRSGHVQNVTVVQSVSPEVDAEAIRAFLYSIDGGYEPFYYAEAILPFKFEVPVRFKLQ